MGFMKVEAYIMSGSGNVFTVIDNRAYGFTIEHGKRLAPVFCHPSISPGRTIEGLIFINEADGDRSFGMDFFNPDGSFGAMCGNGGRCAVYFAAQNDFFTGAGPVRFSVAGTPYTGLATGASPAIYFPPPLSVRLHVPLHIGGTTIDAGYADVGSDHAVIAFSEIERIAGNDFQRFDIAAWGAQTRNHEIFAPRGVNANFYKIEGAHSLLVRTFERGVEAETGACGTGAISTALIATLRGEITPPVQLTPTSGIPVYVDFTPAVEAITSIELRGAVEILEQCVIEAPIENAVSP